MSDINKITAAIAALINALPGTSHARVTGVSLHGCDSARFRAIVDAVFSSPRNSTSSFTAALLRRRAPLRPAQAPTRRTRLSSTSATSISAPSAIIAPSFVPSPTRTPSVVVDQYEYDPETNALEVAWHFEDVAPHRHDALKLTDDEEDSIVDAIGTYYNDHAYEED